MTINDNALIIFCLQAFLLFNSFYNFRKYSTKFFTYLEKSLIVHLQRPANRVINAVT